MITPTYSQLILRAAIPSTVSQAAETKNTYNALTERHLQAMWLEQKYFKPLTLADGSPIEVISPGIWNSEAGPDFLKAHLKVGNREILGDIELHLSQESWYHHHHHQDPRYDQVILHVCYWEPIKEKLILTSQERPIPSTFLHPKLTIPEIRLVKLIDLDLYPYKQFTGSGKCARLLFNRLSEEKTVAFFRSAAKWRLKDKWESLLQKVDDPSKCLVGGIAMALGYKHNAEAFLTLFNHFENQGIRDEKSLLASAMAACGFFKPSYQTKWGNSSFYCSLEKLSKDLPQGYIIRSIDLRLDRIRPANHPIRRLAVLAKILSDPTIDRLGGMLLSCWKSQWMVPGKQKWKKMKEHLLALIPSYRDAYWESHYSFELNPQGRPIALMGEDLKQEILINVLLPFLYTCIEKSCSEEELEGFNQFYASFPATKTKKGIYLSHRFFGETQKKLALVHADTQQGAYQVHRDFCIHFEASCQGCPFVEMYSATFGA